MRYLKQVITDALKCNYITRDPFYNIPLTSKRTNPKYLTEAELAKILHAPFENKILEQTRDIFIFCSLTGLSYIDIKHLTPRHLITDQNGKEYIIKDRKKTGNQSFIPLLSPAKQIIEKYQSQNQNHYQYIKNQKNNNNRNDTDNTLFPISPCQSMNRYLKEIAALCGIDKNLTTHCGRHTCVTLMLTKGVSIESVSKMLGHSDIKTTQIYAKILNEKVQAEISEVESKLNLTLTNPNPQNQKQSSSNVSLTVN